ncbi:PAS domain S-box protein [Lichenicola sp.]|uniref:hybrid sensor histidine kinase/response regulator n=1 Tax=Lichenicola sp. TaxID=2804529 RepID=UPI003AFF964F
MPARQNQQLRSTLATSRSENDRLRRLLAAALRETAGAPTGAPSQSYGKGSASSNELLANAVLDKTMSLTEALFTAGNTALRNSENQFRQLVEAAPNAIVMVNATGRIEMVNARTELLFGYSREEMLGQPLEMLLPIRMRESHPALRSDFMAQPICRPMGSGSPLFGRKKDGSEVEVEIGLSPIETDEGMMVLSAIVDISGRVRMEAQVRQSQKMHAIGRVTAGVAHDFNNLLLALGGSLELLLDAVADQPAAVEWGQIALRATTRGKELTDRLLSFSRRQLLVARPIVIETLFREVKGLIGHLFETNIKARTELVMVPCQPELAVLADLAQLEAALINLAVNARDAMHSGGVLRISAYEAEGDPAIVAPGRYTVISVADSGCGMDADTLAQACEPFFSTKGPNGTGLGLSMVHGFARQSGGETQISSVVGEGTTIDLWLPSARVRPASDAKPATAPPCLAQILVVDDSLDALLVVSAFLRLAGLDVTTKTSGALALAELARGCRFDAIITDFAMPGMNGLELLTRARDIDPAMAGMIITGFSDPGLLSELDGIVVLRKPFNRAELTMAVLALIPGRCPTGPGSRTTAASADRVLTPIV